MRRLLFILVAVSLYAAMHAVVLWGVHPLIAARPRLPAVVVGWMLAMVLAPAAVPALERGGHERFARGLAWVAYTWLGLLFLGFCLFGALGAWELVMFGAQRVSPAAAGGSLRSPPVTLAMVLVVTGVGLYGVWEAEHLGSETIRLRTPKLQPAARPLRIVQLSDLHLGLLHRNRVLGNVVRRVEALRPDLVVATGDVVDAQVDHLEELVSLWRHLAPPLGKFAVTGNHEGYAGLGQSLAFLERSGFRVLRDEAVEVGKPLTVVGVDDPHARRGPAGEGALLAAVDPRRFVLLLKHRPEVGVGPFDLQLSGHTHLGQIFPFRLLTGWRYPLQNGRTDLPDGRVVYTNRGTGTWGPPMRVGAPPEITLVEIEGTGIRK